VVNAEKLRDDTMRIILQGLLIIAVAFAYVTGPYLTVELEHAHEVCGNHGHPHTGHDHDHSHHPHDHDSTPSSGIPDEGDSEGDSHSHTHVVSLGMDTPFTPASHGVFVAHWNGVNHPAAISEFVPDGPCFPLIKPPQLD
jgi:ABC-type nickel/cobalt efflux system permease component RcnA